MSAGSPFWTFSLGTYAKPGVSEACLELQEMAGVDVNALLYFLWLGTQGRRISREETAEAVALIETWRNDVVAPLRHARRALKQPPRGFDAGAAAALRLQVKRAELEAERLQQEALYAWRSLEEIGEADAPAAAAAANLDLYERALAADFAPTPRNCILSAALSFSSPQEK